MGCNDQLNKIVNVGSLRILQWQYHRSIFDWERRCRLLWTASKVSRWLSSSFDLNRMMSITTAFGLYVPRIYFTLIYCRVVAKDLFFDVSSGVGLMGLTSNKPTQYLLDYSDVNVPHSFCPYWMFRFVAIIVLRESDVNCDLTAFDFFLSGFLKTHAYVNKNSKLQWFSKNRLNSAEVMENLTFQMHCI